MSVMATTCSGPAEILARLAQGQDAGAWADLVQDEGPRLYRIARGVLGEHAAAEDAVQEALLHIRKGAARFRPPERDADDAARAWLYRVTVSAARMWARSERRRAHREQIAGAVPAPASTAAAAGGDERLADLRRAIADLPESQRLPLVLHHLGGQDYEQIASAMGISPGSARVRVHRAMERLRKRLTGVATIGAASALLQQLAAGESLPAATTLARWEALPASALPATSTAVIFGGLGLAAKAALGAALCAGLLAVAAITGWQTETAPPVRLPPAVAAPAQAEPIPQQVSSEDHGVIEGTIVALGGGGRITLESAEGRQDYVPHWRGGMPSSGGGPDAEMVRRVRALRIGQRVRITWVFIEHRRIESVEDL